jgi:hypothetical protein
VELAVGIEPTTSPLPRECSTTELRELIDTPILECRANIAPSGRVVKGQKQLTAIFSNMQSGSGFLQPTQRTHLSQHQTTYPNSVVKLARVLCLLWCFSGVASAQQFAFGASLGGLGRFDGGVFGTGLPGTITASARVEWLDAIAKGFALRLEAGTTGATLGVVWRLDLSQQVNCIFSLGLSLLKQGALGLTGRFGFEYRFSQFGVALEYGLVSPFSGVLRSSLLLSFLWFLPLGSG